MIRRVIPYGVALAAVAVVAVALALASAHRGEPLARSAQRRCNERGASRVDVQQHLQAGELVQAGVVDAGLEAQIFQLQGLELAARGGAHACQGQTKDATDPDHDSDEDVEECVCHDG